MTEKEQAEKVKQILDRMIDKQIQTPSTWRLHADSIYEFAHQIVEALIPEQTDNMREAVRTIVKSICYGAFKVGICEYREPCKNAKCSFADEETEKILSLRPEYEEAHLEVLGKAIAKERDRVHIEINKMMEPLKLHLSWITSTDIASEQYGLADEDGDDIDIGIIESALEAYEKINS